MSAFTSFASQAFQVLGAANTVLGAVNNFTNDSGRSDYKAQQQQNALNLQAVTERTNNERARILLDSNRMEEERRAALRRAISKQKAAYGASGTGSTGGSAQAVLLGLVDESDGERQEREAIDRLKVGALDQDVAQQQRLNTLQLTQLKERDKYNRVTSAFDLAKTVSGVL